MLKLTVPVETIVQTPHLLLHSVKGKHYLPLAGKNYWTIGRGKENDLVIYDQSVSRSHAILQSTGTGEFYLIDLGSSNGTFVNGRRVSIPVTLNNSDQITIGKTEVEFHSPVAERGTDSTGRLSERDTLTSVLHERRLTSVMVVDIRNFTVLTRQMDDKALASLIGSWFRQAGYIVRTANSWVDKYIGDAIMAIWFHGTQEVTHENILQIFRAVNDLNLMTQQLSSQYPVPFPLRIGAGINTGYAMVGNTGSEDHPDYTAIGDTVNAAFRLESSTKETGMDIAIGEMTYGYLQDLKEISQSFAPYQVTLKGYENPTLTYGTTFENLGAFLK